MQIAHDATNIDRIIVREIMNIWTKQKHYPILKVAQYEQTTFHYVKITVKNNENHGVENLHIPITITTQTLLNFSIHPRQILHDWKKLNSTKSTWFMNIAVEGYIGDWIIVNLQQMGNIF